MSRNLRLYHAGLYSMNAVVIRAADANWDTQSKCADWTCREVLGHAIWHTRLLAGDVGEGARPEEQAEAEVAGSDPVANWTEARDRVLLGLDRPGALQTEVDGPFGKMAIDDRLRLQASDLYTHSWDIGSALGIDPHLDEGVAAEILPGLRAFGDGLRQPGLMGPEVEVGPDASVVDQFLAYCGRQP